MGEEARVDAALPGLGPARVVYAGVDVGVEAVLAAVLLVPRGLWLLVEEVEADDGFSGLEAVLPGKDNADRRSVLIGKDLSVTAEGEQGERVHGLIHAEAFAVGPVVRGGAVGHLLLVVEGEELDVFGAGEWLAEVDELGERIAIPGNDHGPGFDAAMAVDAGLDRAVFEEVVDVDGLGLLHHAGDLHCPGACLESVGVLGRVGFVSAELVVVVERGGLVEWRLRVGNCVFAGDGGQIGRGFDRGPGVGEISEIACGDCACSDGGGGGEEAAAVLLVLLEGVLRGDFGGAGGGFSTYRAAKKHYAVPFPAARGLPL